MGRPALPKRVLMLKGVDKKNPARLRKRENEPENSNSIGGPPLHLSDVEKTIWGRIVKESIDGVLGEADRLAVEIACRLFVKEMNGEATGVERGQLIKLLSQFGMTPADRSRISIPNTIKKNPFDF